MKAKDMDALMKNLDKIIQDNMDLVKKEITCISKH